MKETIVKLYRKNKGALITHRLYMGLHDTHPDLFNRLTYIDKIGKFETTLLYASSIRKAPVIKLTNKFSKNLDGSNQVAPIRNLNFEDIEEIP